MGWESQQFFHSSMFIAWVFGNVSFVLPVNCFSLSGWAVGFCCMPSLSHPDQLQIHADIQKFIRRLLNANEVHIHPLISQVWILLNGGLRFWTKKLVHVPARPDFITDDCWTYSNSVVRNQHWWSALQLVSDRSISPFRTRAGTFLKLVWKMIILMESDLCQLACFTVSYSFQCKQLFGQHTMISARRTPTDARFAG